MEVEQDFLTATVTISAVAYELTGNSILPPNSEVIETQEKGVKDDKVLSLTYKYPRSHGRGT